MKNRSIVSSSLTRSTRSSSTKLNESHSQQVTENTTHGSPKKKRNLYKTMAIGNKTFKINVKTLREIKRLQMSTKLLIAKAAFSRLVHEIMCEFNGGTRIQTVALQALQEALETYAVQYFEDCYSCALHARRSTLIPRDFQLIRRLRESSC
ncbi:hypothetical protein RN001_005428 [Aquatica leii]|uniref:Core Histone H2A/H2B/H3 domain-containing protein n=1 Tax=Aquatica leii TaxID=1421715 RepID=A0AAN7Q0E1_9COLE|nr:hypothetical protein RN001_005428 [Aquatica leii]